MARSPASTKARRNSRALARAPAKLREDAGETLSIAAARRRAPAPRRVAVGNKSRWRRSFSPGQAIRHSSRSSSSFRTRLRLCLVIFNMSSNSAIVRPGRRLTKCSTPMVGAAKAEVFEQMVGVADEIAIGEKHQLDQFEQSGASPRLSSVWAQGRLIALEYRLLVQRRLHAKALMSLSLSYFSKMIAGQYEAYAEADPRNSAPRFHIDDTDYRMIAYFRQDVVLYIALAGWTKLTLRTGACASRACAAGADRLEPRTQRNSDPCRFCLSISATASSG